MSSERSCADTLASQARVADRLCDLGHMSDEFGSSD
jgi:hypothetical protein